VDNLNFAGLQHQVREQRLSRRDVLKRAAGLGLSAPTIAALLAACGGSTTPNPSTSVSTAAATTGSATTTGGTAASATAAAATPVPAAQKAGGGGSLRILWWQAPTILNPHLSLAGKDVGAIRIYGEPLADFDAKAQLVPILAAEIPSLENGGVAADQSSVTWKLRQGVKWHDGQPFTAADVAFTFQYVNDPKTAATTLGYYQNVQSVDAVDDYTVKVTFKHPVADWFTPFTQQSGQILPQHILKDAVGTAAKTAPFNLKPIGTGPYVVTGFTPGDSVVFDLNPNYWDAGKPFFDHVNLKGGGDATSAARAVMQTGEADWAWNLQIEPAVLQSLVSGGHGQIVTWTGGGTEKLIINHSDPETVVDGQKSSYQAPHPHFKVLQVRQAVALAIQRDVIATSLYGQGGQPTGYTLNENTQFMPKGITWEFNLDKAKQLLDQAGATPGSDGIRVLNGRKMSWVYGSSQNAVRQKEQEIIKAALGQIGIEIQIQAVAASAYFDANNPDSFQELAADFGMETNAAGVYPLLWYLRYLSLAPLKDIAQKENGWSGRNIQRYQNPQFNALWTQASQEVDPAKYTDTFLQMQTLVVNDVADIGLVSRNNVAAAAKNLTGFQPTPYAQDTWDIKNWVMKS